MTEAYNKALKEQAEANVWTTLKSEAAGLSNVQRVQLAADIAGIFDPTPASDAVGAVASAIQGDGWGVGLSLLGMVPYIGDAGKIGKIARIAPRSARALEAVLKASDKLAGAGRAGLQAAGLSLNQVAAARRAATERVRAAMRQARRGNPNCRDCRKLGRQKTSRMPQNGPNGKWKGQGPDAYGNGTYEFTTPKTLPNGRVVRSVEFRNGFPNFDPFLAGGKHHLWEMTGDAGADARALTRQMRETNPNYRPPSGDYTLHHFEDGSVGYVPSTIHNTGRGGVAHTGGASITNNQLF